jgi:hypothetical protein
VNAANPFRDTTTRDLEALQESLAWDLAEYWGDAEPFAHVEALPARTNGAAEYLAASLQLADDELDRRRRLRDRPGAPPWPEHRIDVDRVKSAVDLAAFVRDFVGRDLQKRGARLWCRCPLWDHPDDETPSFAVSPERQLWHCFGCGKGGEVVTLVEEIVGLGFVNAIEVLARYAGIDVDRHQRAPSPRRVRVGSVSVA